MLRSRPPLRAHAHAPFAAPTLVPHPSRPASPQLAVVAPEPRHALQVLIADDDPTVREACAEIAASLGFSAGVADSVAAIRQQLTQRTVDLLLLDLKLPGTGGGLGLLREVREAHPLTAVVVMTAFATVNSAVEAMQLGAVDHLAKPFSFDELTGVLERTVKLHDADVEARQLRETLRTGQATGQLIGRSPQMERLYRILSKVAFTTHPVLILGESGTGKELMARSIHCHGPQAARPFIPVDCGSLVPSLIEGELFGSVRGSGARARDGLLAAAEDGTVFLDDISELPMELQGRLLRALQEKEVRPVGGSASLPMRARILAATSRDLPAMVERGRFRKDLYYRLNVVNLRIPPLRERREDIPLLIAAALERARRELGRTHTLSDAALRLLNGYDWPGNVRELEHAVERACALSSGPILHPRDFPTSLRNFDRDRHAASEEAAEAAAPQTRQISGVQTIADMEKQAILNTIRKLDGDKLMAARLLGIGKTTLYRKLKEYGITDL